jgi:hypothetical protein
MQIFFFQSVPGSSKKPNIRLYCLSLLFRLTGMSRLQTLQCDNIYKVYGQESCLMELSLNLPHLYSQQDAQFPNTLRLDPRLYDISSSYPCAQNILDNSRMRSSLICLGMPYLQECVSWLCTMWRRVWMKLFLFPHWGWQEHTKLGVMTMGLGKLADSPDLGAWREAVGCASFSIAASKKGLSEFS